LELEKEFLVPQSKGGKAMTVDTEKYCPICGRDVKDLSIKRFGEYLCSEEHAEEYVKEVRAQKLGAAAPQKDARTEEPPRRSWWSSGGCCG
jgi:hypothetical protein